MEKIGKILIYEAKNKKYLLLKNLSNHQIIDRPRKSSLPLPNENQLKSTEIMLGREGKGKEGKEGKEARGRFAPPQLDEILNYCKERGNGWSKSQAERFLDYYTISGWKKANGRPVHNWEQCVITWEGKGNDSPVKNEPIQKFQVIGG